MRTFRRGATSRAGRCVPLSIRKRSPEAPSHRYATRACGSQFPLVHDDRRRRGLATGVVVDGRRAVLGGSLSCVRSRFESVHRRARHHPRPGSHRIVEADPWFRFLDRHHYIHHVALGANLNFLLPLADLLFGTLRRQMTPEELAQPRPTRAREGHAAGEGERARMATVTPAARSTPALGTGERVRVGWCARTACRPRGGAGTSRRSGSVRSNARTRRRHHRPRGARGCGRHECGRALSGSAQRLRRARWRPTRRPPPARCGRCAAAVSMSSISTSRWHRASPSRLLAHPAPVVATFHAAGDRTPYRWLGGSLRGLAAHIDARVAVSEPAAQLAQRQSRRFRTRSCSTGSTSTASEM